MPHTADREAVRRLVTDRTAQLVEVLPREEYDEEHLEGAVNLPLRAIDAEGIAALDRGRPVVVYCWDAL